MNQVKPINAKLFSMVEGLEDAGNHCVVVKGIVEIMHKLWCFINKGLSEINVYYYKVQILLLQRGKMSINR